MRLRIHRYGAGVQENEKRIQLFKPSTHQFTLFIHYRVYSIQTLGMDIKSLIKRKSLHASVWGLRGVAGGT